RTLAATLLARHADWSQRNLGDPRPLFALRRFCAHGMGLERLHARRATETRSLADDQQV
ncbi:MAG: hypothetical protein JSS21_05335, partial [Proteobacteria bacterium]|nr:hypothetical protein [Pseudomonadota bacterium]